VYRKPQFGALTFLFSPYNSENREAISAETSLVIFGGIIMKTGKERL
jgi:hypothetical protein